MGCAFPGTEHDCAGEVFTDVLARWGVGLLQRPEPQDDHEDNDYKNNVGVWYSIEDLQAMSRPELEVTAKECGIRVRRRNSKKHRSRKRLIALIIKAPKKQNESG